jgi:DNA-directed RNA polymerase specialized sigma subunit
MEREDLYKLRGGLKNIAHLREEIAALESRRLSPRITAYGSERVQSSSRGDIMPEQEAQMDALIVRYRAELNSTLALQAEFERMIEPLNPLEKRIMRYYYIDGMIWEQIWQETNYSTRHLLRLHRGIMDKLFPSEQKTG